jgi:dTDP-4-dehydrorhamnose reductase
MLARDLIPVLMEGHEVFPCTKKDVDITSRDSVFHCLNTLNPQFLVNCAAYTKVDHAEIEKELAFRVNGIGVQNLALGCAERNIPLCHVSTDYVFDGEKREPYTPFDNTNPINTYGLSKLSGEAYIKWLHAKFSVIRTSWLYGSSGSNFVLTILRLAKEKPRLRVVSDQFGSPTSTATLARGIKSVIENGAYGIYHVTDETEGGISWFDFAQEIVNQSSSGAEVVPITTDEFPRPAKRPVYSVLDTVMTRLATGFSPPDWKKALQEVLLKT